MAFQKVAQENSFQTVFLNPLDNRLIFVSRAQSCYEKG